MSSQFICIRHVIAAIVLCSQIAAGAAHAQNVIEKLVSPGPVSAAHKDQEKTCGACHASFDKQGQSQRCLDCHEAVATDISTRSGFHGKSLDVAGAPCKACHTEHMGADFNIAAFAEAEFNHALTDYLLKGAHQTVPCAECHAEGKKFREAPQACVDCHKSDEPHHGRLGTECQSCHAMEDWKKVTFDHSKTSFPLLGEHRLVQCKACHANEVYKGVSSTCNDCHKADDIHQGAFGGDCESCHQPSDWASVSFDHGRKTGFALTGKHASTDCAACHTGTLFAPKLKRDCASCHRKDDVHKGRNGANCASCHGTASWTNASFDHNRDTKFALRGAHAKVQCEGCHMEAVTKALPGRLCIDCHRADDPHEGAQGENCRSCHNESSWIENMTFDHDMTRFPLLGEHKSVECGACHTSKIFSDAPSDCKSCHADDDKHKGALGEDCALCHTPVRWSFWLFDHDAQTSFLLTGKHEGLICSACHTPGARPAHEQSTACIACHRADDKHHGQFGGDCGRCHSTETFRSVQMNRP